MNYQELQDAVIEITERGENVPRVQLAIAKATLKLHAADFWRRDLVESTLATPYYYVENNRYAFSLDLVFPNFRKLEYIQAYNDDVSPGVVLAHLTEGTPKLNPDYYGNQGLRDNQYYLAGTSLVVQTSTLPPHIKFGYYMYPLVGALDYSSWIATQHPFAIIDEAAAEIFGSVGDADEAQRRRGMFKDNLQLIRINEIEATAR